MDSSSFYKYLLRKGFEERVSQREMMALVQDVVQQGGVKLIEAPTGTGKTFAYLIPLITSGQKAIISTGTKILQDQLRRDIELLSGHYRLLTGEDVRYLILKGKGNYLCLDRFWKESLSEEEKADLPELMEEEWDGDLTLTSVSPEVALKINVDEDYCTSAYREICPYRGECYYWEKIKSREKDANLLVVNHALLALKEFSSTEDRVLIIDEAHELDRYLTLASTSSLSLYWIRDLMGTLGKLLGKEIELTPEDFFHKNFSKLLREDREEAVLDSLERYVEELKSSIYEPLRNYYRSLRDRLKEEVGEFLESRLLISFKLKFYLEKSLLLSPDYLERFKGGYEEPEEEERKLIERVKKVEYLERKFQKFSLFLRITEQGSGEYGYRVGRKWSRKLQTYNYRIEIFPVFPRGIVETQAYKGVILTSATIDPEDIAFTTGIEGEFYRLSKNFNYSGVTFLIKESNPKKEGWEECLKEAYEELRSLYDRLLVLLTNRAHLHLFEKSSDVAIQGEDSLSSQINALREGRVRVLIGLDSLWTGIDVKGEKGILMSKLPFESPEDPLTYHRIRYLRDIGENPFEYQRRKAFIKFRQGVGRLMRQRADSGTIVLCDNRIWRYREFVNFLRELGVRLVYEKRLRARRT